MFRAEAKKERAIPIGQPGARGERQAVGPHSEGISEPNTEGEDGDQEGQREREEDEVDRRDPPANHGGRSTFRGRFGIVPESRGGGWSGDEHGRQRTFGRSRRRVGRRSATESNLRFLTTTAMLRWLPKTSRGRRGNIFPSGQRGKQFFP